MTGECAYEDVYQKRSESFVHLRSSGSCFHSFPLSAARADEDKETFLAWLPWYSLLLFIFLFYVVYIDLKELAAREKKPVYNMHPYPLKGLVYGLIGAVPLAAVVAVLKFLVSFQDEIAENIKRVVVNGFLGPLLFVVKWGNDTDLAYFVSILLIPVITMLGYLAGFYGINVKEKIFGKKPVPEKGFTKSPWNPTLNENKPKRRRKRRARAKARAKHQVRIRPERRQNRGCSQRR